MEKIIFAPDRPGSSAGVQAFTVSEVDRADKHLPCVRETPTLVDFGARCCRAPRLAARPTQGLGGLQPMQVADDRFVDRERNKKYVHIVIIV